MSGMGGRERTGVNFVTGVGGLYYWIGEVYLMSFFRSKSEPSAPALKRIFWDLNGVAVVVKVWFS